ncbi:hypothetical protein CMO92_02625 [Candidatus Woesearchaeota archaeon]|nr:hypothetical protein [Candidatus Woesearchaeota archaeon]|tara:strand:- start:1151 stop:1726 length:576 start_codon:yes stop_codon:yes gene_type:complete
MTFEDTKEQILSRLDKSKKGTIDTRIQNLCNIINKNPCLFTLSSCSGRVAFLELQKGNDKRFANWLIITHDLANPEQFKQTLNTYNGQHKIFFKQESVILHICAKTLEAAQQIVDKARENGFRRSGIFSTRKKINIELISAEQLSTPVFDKQKLITDDYLSYLIDHANKKQKKSWDAIERLTNAVEKTSPQ